MNYSEAENYSKHHFALMEKKLCYKHLCFSYFGSRFFNYALPNISYNNDDQCKCILWSNYTNDIFNEINVPKLLISRCYYYDVYISYFSYYRIILD